jgi:Phosphatidylserine/phosphatidylglycerophosphate/cardiolipin synthases and related enzymes
MSASYKVSSAYTNFNRVRLVRGGRDYFNELADLIRKATQSIHLQVYIFIADETGQLIAEELIEAAKRGVQVFVLADGYASKDLPKEFIRRMRSAGIRFRFFEPLLKSERFYLGRRLHHKVVVADGYYGLVGGINISNNYNDLAEDPSWLDFALLVEGEAAHELQKVCAGRWIKPTLRLKKKKLLHDVPYEMPKEECLVRIRRNDWVKRSNQISRSYVEMLQHSTSHVIIMSSYFLPGRIIRYNLSRAAKRGIKISVIVTGESDIKLAKHAERYMYRWLLKRKIRIFEYTKNILHAKVATSDGRFSTIGSYNVNDISAYASVELNLDVRNEEFAGNMQKLLEQIIKRDCVEVTEESYITKYHFFKRLLQYFSYLVVRVLYYLFTFYFKQQ